MQVTYASARKVFCPYLFWSRVHSVSYAADPLPRPSKPPHKTLSSFTDFPEASPFLIATALLFGELFHHARSAVLPMIPSLWHFTLYLSFPWSPEVEPNCGFWQLSQWCSLNLWLEGTLHQHLELLKFIAELPVQIRHMPCFFERCPLFVSHFLICSVDQTQYRSAKACIIFELQIIWLVSYK